MHATVFAMGRDYSTVYDSHTRTIIVQYPNSQLLTYSNMSSWQIESRDGGETWGRPRNISEQLGLVRGAFVGPGRGVQLRESGRLLFAGWYFDNPFPKDPVSYGGAVWFSDDHGQQWTVSGSTGHHGIPRLNELQLVELPTANHLLLSSRNEGHYKNCRCRLSTLSTRV